MSTRKTIAKKGFDLAAAAVSFDFANGHKVTMNLKDYPEEIQNQLMIHGALQKLGDCYSKVESVTEAIEKQQAVHEALMQGNWNLGGSGGGIASIWLEALARALGRNASDLREKFAAMSKEQKALIRKNKDVLAAHAEIMAERAEAAKEAAEDEEGISLADLDLL